MKIQGKLLVGDIKLHVDVDAPDDISGGEEIYVTNVSPNCLLIPKDRLDIRYLGLSFPVMDELHSKKIHTLRDLLKIGWVLRDNLSHRAKVEVEDAIANFRMMALIVGEERELEVEKPVFKEASPENVFDDEDIFEPPSGFEESGTRRPSVTDQSSVEELMERLGISQEVAARIKVELDVSTVGELRQHSFTDLRGVTSAGTASKIIKLLKDNGLFMRRMKRTVPQEAGQNVVEVQEYRITPESTIGDLIEYCGIRSEVAKRIESALGVKTVAELTKYSHYEIKAATHGKLASNISRAMKEIGCPLRKEQPPRTAGKREEQLQDLGGHLQEEGLARAI